MTSSNASIPTPYEDLLRDVLDNGVQKSDRTGTGTRSVFGRQIRYDLSQGFPLITTKKMFVRGMAEELFWFLDGDTNEHTLRDKNVNFWKEWARDDGQLGPVYGKQMRNVSSFVSVTPAVFDPVPTDRELTELMSPDGARDLNERDTYGVGYMGDYDPYDPHYDILVTVWRQMIQQCYDQGSDSYRDHGDNGAHTSEGWHCFANFQKDAKRIPGWVMKIEDPDNYVLDKDTKLASNRYSVDTCIWSSRNVHEANKSREVPFSAISPEGERVLSTSVGELAREEGMNSGAIRRCLNGTLSDHHGWTGFTYLEAPEGEVLRYMEVDQVREVIASLKNNPDSRRHMISLWNPSEISFMELPPCHGNVIQFYVADGKLSLSMYQRSADMFLGVPVNIASYSLLTHMIAQQVGLEVGEFIWTGGDCHIYGNHVDQVTEQLSREPRPYPRLELTRKDSIFDYEFEDITIVGYDPHPTIKGRVAV